VISSYDREHIGEILAGHGDWFTAKLLRLIAKADFENRAKLRLGFPTEVQAYLDWRDKPPEGEEENANEGAETGARPADEAGEQAPAATRDLAHPEHADP
jgi:hypothetical protein